MNTSPSESVLRPGIERGRRIPGQALFWELQKFVLLAVACSSFFPMLFRFQEHAVIILSVLCVGMCWLEKETPWIKSPLDRPLWLFITWVLCTVPFAVDPAYSFSEWKKFVAQADVFYWSLLVLHRRREKTLPEQVLRSLAMGGIILAGYALIDFVDRGGTWRDRFVRALAFGSDYNWLSTYMVMTVPVIGSLVIMSRMAWARLAGVVALVLAFAAQLFSYTRGGWLGHAAQGVTFALIIGGRRLALTVLGCMVLVTGGLVVASQIGIQTDTVAAKTVDTRLKVWGIGLREVATHPLVGIGYGNNSFIKKFPEYSLEEQAELPERERIIPAMHNAFLMVALGSGLPALLCFGWIFFALLGRLMLRARVVDREDPFMVMALGIGLAVVGFGVRNLFDYMFMGSLAHVFWILAAIGVSVTSPAWQRMGRDKNVTDPQG
jgi:O-antigen ligase